ENGREHRREAALEEMVERELVQGHRDPRRVADDVAEPGARDAGRALHVESPDLRVLARLGEEGRLPDAPELLGVVLGVAVRRRGVRRIRDESERRLARGLGGRELLLDLLELRLHRAEFLQLLRRRLSRKLRPAAQLVDARDERAPALVGGEQRVELLGGAFARERLTPGVGIAAGSLEVDHALSLRRRGGYLPATEETYAATSARCWSVRLVAKNGMPPWPFVTRSYARSKLGIASARFGPTVPVEPASERVWQPVH